MAERKRYRRRPDRPVVAVRLQLETDGFDYRKWNDRQHCKAGDWIVDNEGDVYTVDATTFERTYKAVGTGTFVKTAPIWAEQAAAGGSVETKEGRTHYEAGDFVVSNNEDGSDAWAIRAQKFNDLYEPEE